MILFLTTLVSIGIIESLGYSSKKPNVLDTVKEGVNWQKDGWKVDVKYFKLNNVIKGKVIGFPTKVPIREAKTLPLIK